MRRTVLATTLALVTALTLLVAPAAAATSRVRLLPILSGYSHPIAIVHAPGEGRTMYIAEQTGMIRRATYEDGAWHKAGTFLDLTSLVIDPRVSGNAERGLLGLAFHPGYERNGRFYVNYTRRGSGASHGDIVIAEYRRGSGGMADAGSRRTVLVIDHPASNHNGGRLLFGPDGYLYIAVGDGGGTGGAVNDNGQRLDTLLGKLLRIDPLDPDGTGPKRHRVPATNPLVGREGRDAIWSWGLRNPWGFSFDRANGDLWIGDVGEARREEVDRSRVNANGRNAGKGKNFGWNRCEGKYRYGSTSVACRFGVIPVYDYARDPDNGRCAVTGGYVHRGPAATDWHGLYVAADYCGRLFVLGPKGAVRLSRRVDPYLLTFGEDPAGRIFLSDLRGDIYLVRFAGPRP
jgi:glucose/arabinose dehydrogenase